MLFGTRIDEYPQYYFLFLIWRNTMALTIALCGNEAIESMMRRSLTLQGVQDSWEVASVDSQAPSQKEPDLYATPMLARTKLRAERVLSQHKSASLGAAFEYGVIRIATVVNLIDLNILEMSLEELHSPEFKAEMKRRNAEAERLAPRFESISVASIVDKKGKVFDCMTVGDADALSVSFHWIRGVNHVTASDPALVSVGKRIRNPVPFVTAVRSTLLVYYQLLCNVPQTKN
jgi:hypothetical protein